MLLAAAVVINLVELTDPSGRVIEVNPDEITSLSPPTRGGHYGPGVHCVVNTTDGKFFGVMQSCPMVRDALENKAKTN